MDAEEKMGKISRGDLFQLHVLIEQAKHEIRQKRPEVRILIILFNITPVI